VQYLKQGKELVGVVSLTYYDFVELFMQWKDV